MLLLFLCSFCFPFSCAYIKCRCCCFCCSCSRYDHNAFYFVLMSLSSFFFFFPLSLFHLCVCVCAVIINIATVNATHAVAPPPAAAVQAKHPPHGNDGTPLAHPKSNLLSTDLQEIECVHVEQVLSDPICSDPSIEDLRTLLDMHPLEVTSDFTVERLSYPVPNSHFPIVKMLCKYVLSGEQCTLRTLVRPSY